MMQTFRPRSWRLRADAAKHRAIREESMADVRAVRAALAHGEEPPADVQARLAENHRRLVEARGGDRYAAVPAIESAPADEPAKAPVARGRKAGA